MNTDTVRQVLVVISTIATITVNVLANILPLNGLNTGEISDRFRVFFVPAGYVFSIWGLIYILMIAFTVYQALPAQRENPILRQIGYIYIVASAANIIWLFLWHYEVFSFTLVAMLALLGSLIAIYIQIRSGAQTATPGFRWTVLLTFSVYLGWITVATIANASQLLYFLNWSGWGIAPEIWTVIMLAAAALITGAMLFLHADIAYALVIVWAVVGIALKHAETRTVSTAAWVVVGLIAVLIVISVVGVQTGRLRTT